MQPPIKVALHGGCGCAGPMLAPQNCMRGAMAIAMSSWNSSLHAYGMCTCALAACQVMGWLGPDDKSRGREL